MYQAWQQIRAGLTKINNYSLILPIKTKDKKIRNRRFKTLKNPMNLFQCINYRDLHHQSSRIKIQILPSLSNLSLNQNWISRILCNLLLTLLKMGLKFLINLKFQNKFSQKQWMLQVSLLYIHSIMKEQIILLWVHKDAQISKLMKDKMEGYRMESRIETKNSKIMAFNKSISISLI